MFDHKFSLNWKKRKIYFKFIQVLHKTKSEDDYKVLAKINLRLS